MAEKAIIQSAFGIKVDASGNYVILVRAQVTNGVESFVELTCPASSPLLIPVVSTWRVIVRDAVVAAALARWGLVVDTVLFPDLSLLSV